MGKELERKRPKPRFTVWLMAALGFALLYVPLITMVVSSFRVVGPESIEWGINNYLHMFDDPEMLDALGLSFWIALMSTMISVVIGTMGAIALERTQFPGKKFLTMLTLFPLTMPEIVMGLSLLIWFGLLRITLGSFSIILAHVTFCLSYVIVIVRARLQDFDPSLEEAARDLGAPTWRVLTTVTLPTIFPGVLAAALMAFTLSFDDFLITFYTAGVGSETLPLKIYSLIRLGINPSLTALSTVMLMTTILVVSIVFAGPGRHRKLHV